jgi:hypothetical protein
MSYINLIIIVMTVLILLAYLLFPGFRISHLKTVFWPGLSILWHAHFSSLF